MNISIDILAERLKKYHFVQYCGKSSEPILESTRLLHRYMDKFEPQYLYIGIAEDIERLNREFNMKYVTVICCGVPDTFDTIGEGCNFYYVDRNADFGMFYNDVEDVFSYYNRWELKLKNLCSTMGSLQQMLDVSDEIFPYPISLVDGAERTIAYSRDKECDDAVWQYIKEGYIRTEYLLRDNIHSKDILHQRAPKQLYTTASNRYVMLQPVIVQRHTVAFVSLMMIEAGTKVFTRGTEQLLMVLTREITSRLEADEFYGLAMGEAVEFFLADLIGKKKMEIDTILDRANFLNLDIYKKRRIFCICYENAEMAGIKRREIMEATKRRFPKCIGCFHEGNAVFFEEYTGMDKDEEDMVFQNWLKKEKLLSGISIQFFSLFEAADYYEQAKTAIRLGREIDPNKKMYAYKDYIVQHGLEQYGQKDVLQQKLHPVVLRILELYGEDDYMIKTVTMWLKCERHISAAAKLLHVHRNTMLYRIEGLIDKLGYDFSEQAERLQIMYSLEIVDYIKNVKKEKVMREHIIE